jgi:heat shock protein HslJ
MLRTPLVLPLLLAAACVAPAASRGIEGTWELVGIDFRQAAAPLTITFDATGGFSGQAPCNRFFGKVSGVFPAISLGEAGATKMACADLGAESAYLDALSTVQGAEISEGHLFLSGPEGRVIEFTRGKAKDGTCLSCLAAK